MEISPALQLQMYLAALLAGFLLGLLSDAGAALRIPLGAHTPPARFAALYARPLPLLKRPLQTRPPRRARRIWRQTVTVTGDAVFCLVFAVTVELILYEYNCGAFRVGVPLVALLGFAAWRASVSRVRGVLTGYLAFGVSAAWLYLKFFAALPARALRRFLWRPLRRLAGRWHTAHRARYTARRCRVQLKRMAEYSAK